MSLQAFYSPVSIGYYTQLQPKMVLPVHTRVVGLGFHLPSTPHTAVILPAGTNPGLHLKYISDPSSVFRYASTEPLSGVIGCPQVTEVV